MDCCQNSNIKLINGVWTCINCGLVHRPQVVQRWIEYNSFNVIPYKTVYSRTDYILRKLKDLQLSSNKIEAFMKVWSILESKLKTIRSKRFPKLDFFISKILEGLNILRRHSYKISSALRKKYDMIWENIIFENDQKLVDMHLQLDHQSYQVLFLKVIKITRS